MAPILTVSSDALGGRILCARPHPVRSSSSKASTDGGAFLLVSHGSGAQPMFAEVRAGPTRGAPAIVTRIGAPGTRSTRGSAKASDTASKPAAASAPTVLGPLEVGVVKRQKRSRAGGEEAPEKRPRLDAEQDGGALETAGGLSVAPLVRQALRSKDRASMEKVLMMRDRRAIDSTVAELTGFEAFDLLQECTTHLLMQPASGGVLCAWMRCVLAQHCSFISSQPQLKAALLPLEEAFKIRLSVHKRLVRLRWRIREYRDLGKEMLEAKGARLAAAEGLKEPLVEYVEGHSDDEEEEDDDDDEEDDEDEEDEEEGGSSDIWADESDDE